MRRKRYQKGSLQKRKHRRISVWVGLWWEGGSRRYKTLGRCSKISQGQAREELNKILQPLNRAVETRQDQPTFTLGQFIREKYLPFAERSWKESTAQTSKQRIIHHLAGVLGECALASIKREQLQGLLEEKVKLGLSASVVSHLRWDLRSIFQLAIEDGLLDRNPATSLVTPSGAKRGERKVMRREDVKKLVASLAVRERLITSLAVLSGMRPGEIFGLKWRHLTPDGVVIEQRLYRGKLGTPKTERSVRIAALAERTVRDFAEWKTICQRTEADAWVFPSERLVTPLSKDNWWRRNMEPLLEKLGLPWVNFQVMRRTHASLSRQAGIDPKVVADQLGHGLGVSLNVYTKSDVEQKQEAVRKLEAEVIAA